MAVETAKKCSDNNFFLILSKCPVDKLAQLLHHLIDVFCGQEHLYTNFSELYSLLDWWDLIHISNQFFKLPDDKKTEFDNLNSEYEKIINEVLDVRSSDLKECLIEKSHEVSPSYLESFDWKVKFVMASDKLSQINEPRLSLDLNLSGNNAVHLDLSKTEVKNLIETLEKAKKSA